jgi:hypothetical protein
MKIDWRTAARDVLLILVIVFVAVQATALLVEQIDLQVILTASFAAMVAGFCVAGCLTPRARFGHLSVVAVGVWLLGTSVNSFTRDLAVQSWLKLAAGALLPVAAAMLLGGAISMAVVRTPEADQPVQESGGDSSSSQA